MNKRLHPPIQQLRAFIVTAQLGTVSQAAEALHVTQSAVSKQIQDLERYLNLALFTRVRKRLCLTPSGQRYCAAVRPLLAQLEAATLEVMSTPVEGGVLHLSVLPTFGAKWLMPRLGDFQRAHPKVQLQFVPYVHGYDFSRPDLDCAIRYGEGAWHGAVAEYLIGRRMALIAPPSVARGPRLARPSDIAAHRLLQHTSVPHAWAQWCERHGVSGVNTHGGIQLDQYTTIIGAVAAGLGIALVPACLVAQELTRGEVVAPPWADDGDDPQEPVRAGYFLCYPDHKADLPSLVSFRRWLLKIIGAAPRAAANRGSRRRCA
jgi:LysR family transcriptional regulator, glycine cleavage system transcriptional activator